MKVIYSGNLFHEAQKYIPGGVNSPVRSFRAVGGYPIFVNHGKGSKVYNECGREFIDYCQSFGALILGHAHPKVVRELRKVVNKGTTFGTPTKLETELAKIIIEDVPSIQKIRFTNSGTEAVMGAIRLARAYTKRDKIIKFEGSYHGHADYLLDCEGVPRDFTRHTLITPYNNIKVVKDLIEKHEEDVAAIIVEPIAANMGVVLPKDDFLSELRKIASKYNIILIFDEVITGFRLIFGGAQKIFDIKPDLTCLGKIIGGGLPIGAFGGRREIMQLLAPEGPVYQAGTFSGNPVSMSAGISTLRILHECNPYRKVEGMTKYLCGKIKEYANKHKIGIGINSFGSMFSIFFTNKQITDYSIAKAQDTSLFKKFYHGLLKNGVYFSPSGLEADFISLAHTQEDMQKTLRAVDKTFRNLRRS
ncbi:MAG: glutamate-1-semialdehyde 2,1-aminomutase [Candidatus Omnitrophota bacterium]